MTNFATQLDALIPEMRAFTESRVLEIKALLEQADALRDELRAAGLPVDTRFPISPSEPLSRIRFEVRFDRRVYP